MVDPPYDLTLLSGEQIDLFFAEVVSDSSVLKVILKAR